MNEMGLIKVMKTTWIRSGIKIKTGDKKEGFKYIR